MKILLLVMMLVLCACGVRVHKEKEVWVCEKIHPFGNDVFKFNTIEEANERCRNLYYGLSPLQNELVKRVKNRK